MKNESIIKSNSMAVFLVRHLLWYAMATFCIFWLVSSPVQADGQAADTVDNTRSALEQWVETRKVISQEKSDWALGKEMLTERVELVQKEIDTLNVKMKEAEKNISEGEKKRNELLDENEKLKESSVEIRKTVFILEKNTKDLLRSVPDPIRDRVKPLSQRFPDDPEDTKLSLSERFQNVLGVLNEINKFNRIITATSEVRALPDGSSAEVTVLYLGIGQAYYASSNGIVAGTGTSTRDGWVWTPANGAAKQISEAIAVLKNEKVASFVQLPMKIQ